MKLQPSPVKQWALAHGIAVVQPRGLRLDGKYPEDAAAARDALLAPQPDVLVVAAYGLILPQWVLNLPRLGCLNIHASLLPRWRGAAPIQRAIEAGDAQTGVTIMQMDAGLDTGDVLLAESLSIDPRDSAAMLHDKLAALGGRLIARTLKLSARGGLHATPQPTDGVSYAHKIDKREAVIAWTQPAAVIERRIRAFDPFPGASGTLGGVAVKLWRAEICRDPRPPDAQPGQILSVDDEGVTVVCGHGALTLTELQRPGGKRLPAREFLRGFALRSGQCFELPASGTSA
jgi:methionyl-tRNA formyltransferase